MGLVDDVGEVGQNTPDTFSDPALAARARDVFDKQIVSAIDRERPGYVYGTVQTIDPLTRTASVLINGDSAPITASFGAIRPTSAGQVVRVEGKTGDRYIADVMGGAVTSDSNPADLGAPQNVSMGGSYRGIFIRWDIVLNAYQYEVQLADNAGMSTNVRTYKTLATGFTEEPLNAGQVVYGRVRALTSYGGQGAWSSVVSATAVAMPVESVTDGVAPSSSPTAVVTGALGFLEVQWAAISNSDPTTYEVHISTTNGFTPSGATKVGETSGTFYAIRTMPDGTTLAYGTTYFVRLKAKDRDGSAAAGGQGSGSILKVGTADVSQIDYNRLGDGNPPAFSPTPTITPGVGYLYCAWTALAEDDYTIYDVHISTVSGFTPSSATRTGGTPSDFFFIRKLGSGDGGGPLVYGTTYYVKLVAKDVDGSASPSPQASGVPLQTGAGDLSPYVTTANLVFNGSFEEPSSSNNTLPAGWTQRSTPASVTVSLSTAQAKDGDRSLRFAATSTSASGSWASQAIPVSPGQVYTVEAWHYTDVTITSGIYIRASFGNVDTFDSSTEVTNVAIASNVGSSAGVWTQRQGQITVPSGVKYMKVTLHISAPSSAVNLYFDAVRAYSPVDTVRILDLAVGSAKIQDLAVTTAKVALAAIDTAQIANLAVQTAKIADAAIANAKIQDLAVNNAKVNDMSASKLTAGTIAAQQIVIGSGGSFKIGSAPTGVGMLINDQGLSLYNSGGTRTIYLDGTTGNGTITSATITGGLIRTASTGNHIEINSSSDNRISFFSGSASEATPGLIYSDTVFDAIHGIYVGRLLLQAISTGETYPTTIFLRSRDNLSVFGDSPANSNSQGTISVFTLSFNVSGGDSGDMMFGVSAKGNAISKNDVKAWYGDYYVGNRAFSDGQNRGFFNGFDQSNDWGLEAYWDTGGSITHQKLKHYGNNDTNRICGVVNSWGSTFNFWADGTNRNIYSTGNAWLAASQRSLKHSIVDLHAHRDMGNGKVHERFKRLKPVTFKVRDSEDQSTKFGFVAEDFQTAFPELTHTIYDPNTDQEVLAIGHIDLIPVLTTMIHHLTDRIEALERSQPAQPVLPKK